METNPESQNSSTNDSSFYFDDDTALKSSHLTGNLSTTNLLSKNKQLLSENTKLKETIKDLQARLELLESNYKQNSLNMSDELKNAKNETIETKKSLISSVKNLESKLDEQVKVNSKLVKENKELKSQIDSFLHSVESRSKKQVTTLTQASDIYDDLYSMSESASEKIKNLENRNSSLIDQLSETSDLVKSKEAEASKLKKKLKKATKQISQTPIDQEELQKITKLHEKEMENAQSIISEQNETINQMQKRIEQTAQEKIQFNDFVNSNYDLNQVPKENGTYVSSEIYETNINILQNKLQTTEQLLNNKDEAISSLQDTIDSLKEKCDDMSHQLQEAHFTIATNEDNYKLLKEKAKQSKQTIQKLRDELSSKETELAEYDTTIHELQLKINELETEKSRCIAPSSEAISQKYIDNPKESILQYKETIKLYENRINELDELFENQSKEISELYEQRKSIISKLIQFDQLLTKNEALDQELSKSNKVLLDENNQLKSESKAKADREKDAFNRSIEECLEIIPKEVAFAFQQFNVNEKNSNAVDYYGVALKNFVQTLVSYNEKINKEKQIEVAKNKSDDMKKANVALLEHLQNSCKIIRSFANSGSSSSSNNIIFPIDNKDNQFDNEIDSNPRTFLLATCARLDKFIQNHKINLPIDEFRPSIFEPRELNDPQKVADVFLDFIEPESFGKSPIAELFTLFMCVCQVNQILIKNIDDNKAVIQQATRSSQNEAAYFKQLTELEKWKNKQSELNDKLKPFLVKFIEHEDKEKTPQADFYEYDELVEKVISLFDQNGEIPINSQTADLIQKIDDLEKQVDILQKEIEESHRKQENDRQLFCKKANKIVTQVQRRLEANNRQHEEEKAQLSSQLDETKKQLDNSKVTYVEELNKAQKKLQKKEEMINSLRNENENLSQRTVTIQEMLSQSKSQVDSDTDMINALQKQLDDTRKQLDLAINQKKLYKKKLEEIEENNMSILSSLRQRSEELNSKYENSIANLEKELNSTRVALEQAKKEAAEIDQKKQELTLSNAKLKMSERTASLKLIAANEALEREKQASEMRQKSIALALKAESDASSAENEKIFTQAIELFNRIMIDEFDLWTTSNFLPDSNFNEENFDVVNENLIENNNIVNNKDTLLTIMNEVGESLDTRKAQQFAINDALRLRRLLKLNSSASLIDAFKSLEEESLRLKQEAENMKTKSINAEAATLRTIRDNKKLERAAIELAEWTNWSKIMLRHLSDVGTQGINQTSKETRFILEEALLATLNQKSIRKKIEILRFEKKILLSQKPLVVKTNAQLRAREPLKSINPLIIAFNFARRIQDMSGMLPSRFNMQ